MTIFNSEHGRRNKAPIRVLHFLPALWRGTGIARFVYNMALFADEKRVHFDFAHAAVIDGVPIPCGGTFDEELRSYGSQIYTVNHPGDSVVKFAHDVAVLMAEHGDEYDIVHCHMPNGAFCILREAKKAGVPVRILHSHLNTSSDVLLHRIRNAPLIAIGKRCANANFACSDDAGRYLFGSDSFEVVRNGIPVGQYAFSESTRMRLREEFKLEDDAPIVGCVGRLEVQKNYPFALKVFKEFLKTKPGAKLVVLGEGAEKDSIARTIRELHLEQRVMLLGHRDDVNKLYSLFDVLFMPSLCEGLPVAAVEAQASGLPCVFSDGVPRETDIIGEASFLPIGSDFSEWVGALVDACGRSRFPGAVERVENSGYSARTNAAILMGYYESLMAQAAMSSTC